MVRGLRVMFSPNPATRALYSYRVPVAGACGTVTAVRTAGGVRTYLDGVGSSMCGGTQTASCAASPCGT